MANNKRTTVVGFITLASVIGTVPDPLWALRRAAGSTGLGCCGVSEKGVTSEGSQKLGVSS